MSEKIGHSSASDLIMADKTARCMEVFRKSQDILNSIAKYPSPRITSMPKLKFSPHFNTEVGRYVLGTYLLGEITVGEEPSAQTLSHEYAHYFFQCVRNNGRVSSRSNGYNHSLVLTEAHAYFFEFLYSCIDSGQMQNIWPESIVNTLFSKGIPKPIDSDADKRDLLNSVLCNSINSFEIVWSLSSANEGRFVPKNTNLNSWCSLIQIEVALLAFARTNLNPNRTINALLEIESDRDLSRYLRQTSQSQINDLIKLIRE